MNQERLMTVLLEPHVSEKATLANEQGNQVVFKVRRDASKAEIGKAVEMMFEVKVEAVQVALVKGKIKRFGSALGRRPDWKKAYVRLAPGQDIDFLGGE
ncbi:MAG TPA: 50S ribosomal protein L23 [Gammaproteobacteria bacterium]|nr:50S ribosomal protein L23 [Gammaproteobacteria bacterium]